MKHLSFKNISVIFLIGIVSGSLLFYLPPRHPQSVTKSVVKQAYWLLLKRESNKEYLYKGIPGEVQRSSLVRMFVVKTGIPGERPTPLPQKVGRAYWLITKKEVSTSSETAPYFLTLNVPGIDTEPYGPTPYTECGGQQCNWIVPGAFGLHGVNGDTSRLGKDDPGSSGCIRHSDEDITYLYNLLHPEKEPIRYYIQES